MSSLHQGFQETGEPGSAEAVFRWLDGADESPLIQQVKRQMLEVCPVGEGIRSWTWAADSGMRYVASPGWRDRGGGWPGSTPIQP